MAAAAAPLLTPIPIQGFGADGTIAPAKKITLEAATAAAAGIPLSLVGGLVLKIAGEDYHLLKFLGGGTFGKVWAALHRPSNNVRTVKFIKYDDPDPADESRRLNNAKKEAIIGAILYTKKHTVCSPVYGVGLLDGGAPLSKSKYFVLCGDRYSETIDDYLERELGNRGASGSPARKQLITDVLYGLYRTLKSVNIPGQLRFNHGDPKLDNYMISDGRIRMVDMGFAHLEEPDVNLMANRTYNENNNDTMRDLLQNLLELSIYREDDIPAGLKRIADTIMRLVRALPGSNDWHKTYDFVDNTGNRAIITYAVEEMIAFLKANTSTALAAAAVALGAASPMTPYYSDESNSHSNIAGMAATASAAAEEDDTRAVIEILKNMPAAPGPLDVAADATGTAVGFLAALAAAPTKAEDIRDDAMHARIPPGGGAVAAAAAVAVAASLAPSSEATVAGAGAGGGGGASLRGPSLALQSYAFAARNPFLHASDAATVGGAGGVSSTPGFAHPRYGAASSTPTFFPPGYGAPPRYGGASSTPAFFPSGYGASPRYGGASSTPTFFPPGFGAPPRYGGGAGGPSGGGWAPVSSHAASVALGPPGYTGTNPFEGGSGGTPGYRGGRRSRSRSRRGRTQKKRKTKVQRSKTRSRKTA